MAIPDFRRVMNRAYLKKESRYAPAPVRIERHGDFKDEVWQMGLREKLTEEQKKAVTDAAVYIDQALEQARSRITAAGVKFDPDETYCFLCPCPSFSYEGSIVCATEGCGHSLGRHHVW